MRGHLRPVIAWINSRKIKIYFAGLENQATIWVLEGWEEDE